jgi:uncharacterized membrane protein
MTETPPDTPVMPVPAKISGWTRALLIGSLSLNLLVFGVVVGGVATHAQRPLRVPVGMVDFGPYSAALSDQERRALRADYAERGPNPVDARRVMRAEIKEVLAALRADPWMPDAARSVLERQRDRARERVGNGIDILMDHFGKMSAAERAAFADRLEENLRRPRGGDRRD